MRWKGLPVVIFGTGDTAREVSYLIEEINQICKQPVYHILGFIAEHPENQEPIRGYSILGGDEDLKKLSEDFCPLGVVIPMANPFVREKIVNQIQEIPNLVFPNIIHPNVTLRGIKMGIGNIIQDNVDISIGLEMGDYNFVNYGTFLGHDVVIGNYCVISPQSKICGKVRLQDKTFIGVSATVLQGLEIGESSTIGAGAVVTKSVPDEKIMVGVPAKEKEGR